MTPLSARILSSLVLAPPALAAFYAGSPYSDLLVLLAAGILAWEWSRLCGRGALGQPGYLVIATAVTATVAGAFRAYEIAGWVLAAGAMAATALAGARRAGPAFWYPLGAVYVTLPCLAILWLRQDPAEGRAMIFWLLLVVWSTDTGAYAAGRRFGGPKLALAISPNKTWAGLLGGMTAAAAVGVVAALLRDGVSVAGWAAGGAALAVVAQAGDLFESAVKRRLGVKDSSNLIPGHGGLLDRADGLMAAGLGLAVFVWLKEASI